MVVIFPKCAILPIKSSMLRGAVCSQCDSAFRVQKLSYYSNYRHGSCFQMLNSFMDMGDKYENQYPDLQFTRFGDLCINCRAPYIGEGNFEVSSLDIEGLSAQGANVGLAGVITNLIYDYYTKRVFPEFKLYPDPELAASPAIQIINNELLYIHKDVMSMPGVEHVFWGEMAIKKHIRLDMRWWRPKQCKCTRLPFCECVCMAAQVRNIVNKINANTKVPILRGRYVLASIPLQQNIQEYDFLAVLEEPRIQTTLSRHPNPYESIYLDKGEINAGYCKTYLENTKGGSFTNHTSDCGRRVFFRRTRGSPCSADKTTCGRCVDCREKENERRKVVNMVREILF